MTEKTHSRDLLLVILVTAFILAGMMALKIIDNRTGLMTELGTGFYDAILGL